MTFVNHSGAPHPVPPFRLTFPTEPKPTVEAHASSTAAPDAGTADSAAADPSGASTTSSCPAPGEMVVESYVPPDPGPYPQDQPRRNMVRFTPVQVRGKEGGYGGTGGVMQVGGVVGYVKRRVPELPRRA